MPNTTNIDSGGTLLDAVQSSSPPKGFTHTFYRYPARFSPEFARSAIRTFTKPGDLILDPFMGSGTVLVEALVSGRHAVGSDISSLAHFISKVKTTLLTRADLASIQNWAGSVPGKLNLRHPGMEIPNWTTNYVKYLPWAIRKTIELALLHTEELENGKQKDFARCALLRTAQWALDCTREFPIAAMFRSKFIEILDNQVAGIEQMVKAVGTGKNKPTILCFNREATALRPALWQAKIDKKPSLVVTSPPYPSVHVLYHRWQINGRRETPAPFWIAGTHDGQGESYYTMGSRSRLGAINYFACIQESFSEVHKLLARDATVVQLIAFSDIKDQLPKYLSAMEQAGYCEVEIDLTNRKTDDRVWRQVPLRKWYATLQGNTSSSRELLLIHRRLD